MLTHCHTIGASNDVISRLKGAIAFLCVWGLGEFIGPLSPILLLVSASFLPWYLTALLLFAMGFAFVVAEDKLYSPAWCRFVLWQACRSQMSIRFGTQDVFDNCSWCFRRPSFRRDGSKAVRICGLATACSSSPTV